MVAILEKCATPRGMQWTRKVSQDPNVKRLIADGKIKPVRRGVDSFFGPHIRRTFLVAARPTRRPVAG